MVYPPPTCADQNCGNGCHSISSVVFEGLISGLSLSPFTRSGFELFSPQSVTYNFLIYSNFGVVLELKGALFAEGLCQGLQNICSFTPNGHPNILGICLNSDMYFFSCLFFHIQVLQFFPHVFIAKVSMSCAGILWVWLKDKAYVFSVVCVLITNMK